VVLAEQIGDLAGRGALRDDDDHLAAAVARVERGWLEERDQEPGQQPAEEQQREGENPAPPERPPGSRLSGVTAVAPEAMAHRLSGGPAGLLLLPGWLRRLRLGRLRGLAGLGAALLALAATRLALDRGGVVASELVRRRLVLARRGQVALA